MTYFVAAAGSDSNDGKSEARPFKTFDHAMATLKAALTHKAVPVQVLFRRGDHFTTNSGVSFGHYKDGKPAIIGAYGSGRKPVIQNLGGENDFTFFFGECSGFRWMDLELTGTYDFKKDIGPSTTHVYLTDKSRDFLMYRVTSNTSGQLFIVGSTNPMDKEELFVVDCDMKEFEGVGVHIAGKYVAVIGTSLIKSSFTHLLRIWYADRGVFSENILHYPSYNHPYRGRHALKFHADTGSRSGKSRYSVVSDNEFLGCTWSVVVGPQDTVSTEYLEHIVIEKNLFVADSYTRRALLIIADDVTVRNNLFFTEEDSTIDTVNHITIAKYSRIPDSKRVRIFNNTAVDLRTDSRTARFLDIETTSSAGLEVRNNIFYAPSKTGDTSCAIRFLNSASLANLSSDYNLWYLPGLKNRIVARDAAMRKGYTLPEWQSLGEGGGSKDENPRFSSPELGHLFLEEGSPAIDAGSKLPGIYESMNGVRRPQGPATDMGAFEAPGISGAGDAALIVAPRTPAPGNTVKLSIDAPGAGGFRYQIGLSFRTFPAIHGPGGIPIPLADDSLLRFSVLSGNDKIFWNFTNSLDAGGKAQAGVAIPLLNELRGAGFFAAALVWDSVSVRVTNPVPICIN